VKDGGMWCARMFPVLAVSAVLARPAFADADAGTPDRIWSSCIEHVPSGARRPLAKDQFPSRGISGYVSTLTVVVEHGKGETVLPQGFQVQAGGDAYRALVEAGFIMPDPDGGAAPVVSVAAAEATATTSVAIPFLLLPKDPGRATMVLPPVPIAVARANGEIVTLCTSPHQIVVEDPTASVPDATPKPNPDGRPQREEWTLAKQLTLGALIGAAIAALAAWLIVRFLRRPRPPPPPPPPVPPWETAFEELHAARHAGLVPQARYAEHYDRVSDAARKYLGGMYGFDGLETTSYEMVATLETVTPRVVDLDAVGSFLSECDLVKFAKYTPSEADCWQILDRAETIVRVTMPRQAPAPAKTAGGSGGTP
jgi:hypothetical protein